MRRENSEKERGFFLFLFLFCLIGGCCDICRSTKRNQAKVQMCIGIGSGRPGAWRWHLRNTRAGLIEVLQLALARRNSGGNYELRDWSCGVVWEAVGFWIGGIAVATNKYES